MIWFLGCDWDFCLFDFFVGVVMMVFFLVVLWNVVLWVRCFVSFMLNFWVVVEDWLGEIVIFLYCIWKLLEFSDKCFNWLEDNFEFVLEWIEFVVVEFFFGVEGLLLGLLFLFSVDGIIVVIKFLGLFIYWCCFGRGCILCSNGMGEFVFRWFMWMNCFSCSLLFRIRLLCFLVREIYVVCEEFEILM